MTRLSPLQYEAEARIGIPRDTLTADTLASWQLERINHTLAYVRAHSPFFREHLKSSPEKLSSLDEICLLPFTTAQDIARENLHMVCVPQDEIERIVTLDTSGTTGQPKRIFFTKAEQQMTIFHFGNGQTTFNHPGEKALILLPGTVPGSVGDLLAQGLQAVGVTGVQNGYFTDPFAVNQRIDALQIDNMTGTPKQIFTLMRAWQKENRGECPVKAVLLCSDYASPALMKAIQEGWGCKIYQHYGMTEAGLGVGMDCSEVRGFHLREADMLFEIIDPTSGKPCKIGEAGELVFTTLTRTGMPLIRYRSKDITHWIPGGCPCGTILRTAQWVRGRTDDQAQACSMPDLDDLIFTLPDINGFDASLDGNNLLLEMYWRVIPETTELYKIKNSLLKKLPLVGSIEIKMFEGFPASNFDLRKKRIRNI